MVIASAWERRIGTRTHVRLTDRLVVHDLSCFVDHFIPLAVAIFTDGCIMAEEVEGVGIRAGLLAHWTSRQVIRRLV